MKQLRLSSDLALPLEAVTEKFAWLGRTGSGKTYGSMKLAELMLEAGAQIGVLDPVGVWRALRVPAAPGGQSFEVVVFGGLYGDLPLEPTKAAGELVADLVVERGLSFVLDVSQFIPSEQQQFVQGFSSRFFQRKKTNPTAIHLFLEECQEFIPENPSGQEATTLGFMQRMWKLGRNYGIGGSLISQRPQEIAKKALNMSGTLFAFQMTGPQERAAVKKWVADQGIAADIEGVLQRLQRGQPHVELHIETDTRTYSHSGVVAILPRVTADLSKNAAVGGAASVARRPLTPIDVEQLKVSMAATIEKAKADDPRELRKEIADLKKRLSSTPVSVPTERKATSTPILTEADRALLEKVATRLLDLKQVVEIGRQATLGSAIAGLSKMLANFETDLMERAAADEKAFATLLEGKGFQKILGKLATVTPAAPHVPLRTSHSAPAPRPVVQKRTAAEPAGSLPGVQQKVLNALAELEQLGAETPDRELVAFLSGYSHLNSKGFTNAIGGLRSSGFIEYGTGTVSLTTEGRALAVPPPAPRSPRELQDRIITMLGGASGRILDPLIEAYPKSLPRAGVASAAGYEHVNSKGFTNAIGRLRTLGFIDYPQPGQIVAKSVLFLEGAR